MNNVYYNLPTEVTTLFEEKRFPSGERNIFIEAKYLEGIKNREVFFTHRDFDVMSIGMKVDILRRAGVLNVSIALPFLPYARQDRYTVDGSSFSLKVFAGFINGLNLRAVYVLDAHSDVSGVIDNLIHLPIAPIVSSIVKKLSSPLTIISPDAGAAKKIYSILANIDHDFDLVIANKHRDLKTGEIKGIWVPPVDSKNDILVIDDICDGGRTFIELSKKLPKDANKYLYVTHGIFSKREVYSHYKKVYTTDSFSPQTTAINLSTTNLKFTG